MPARLARQRVNLQSTMPELPEVESLRLHLRPHVVGRTVTAVHLGREDVVTTHDDQRPTPERLLLHRRIKSLHRHGKNLFVNACEDIPKNNPSGASGGGRALRIHLGMTGNLLLNNTTKPHSHITWTFDDHTTLTFRDPRRFGGVWTLASEVEFLKTQVLPQTAAMMIPGLPGAGVDALTITPGQLHAKLARTTRPLKTALLDQRVLAGLGNIYVDELLFAIRRHPLMPANALTLTQTQTLVRHMRRILRQAITAGGSTLRDHRSPTGGPGTFQSRHQVYGKFGHKCPNCPAILVRLTLAERTTTACPQCQEMA